MTGRTAPAHAKLNLALVVGPVRGDGKHEVVTLLQRLELADTLTVRCADRVAVDGFGDDTLVAAALTEIRARTGSSFAATIEKRVPVAAGLGGGSSDAATALQLANEALGGALPVTELHEIARRLGSDVPFFLESGPRLGTGDGSVLEPVEIAADYTVLLVRPPGAAKQSTASVYAAFDERGGEAGFEARRAVVLDVAARPLDPATLQTLPPNDLATSPVAERLRGLGAFRADVTGAGPLVYGLFADRGDAEAAASAIEGDDVWLTAPLRG